MWKVRKMALWAAKLTNADKDVLVTDVAVLFSRFNDSLVRCKRAMDASWL